MIGVAKAPRVEPTSALWIGNDPKKRLGVFSFGQRRLVQDDAYHVDYVFVAQNAVGLLECSMIASRAEGIATGLSDHAPLILDFDPSFAADV